MSAKVGRLKPGQPHTAKPYRYVSKVVAAYLVRNAICETIGNRLIRDKDLCPVEASGATTLRVTDAADGGAILPPRGPENLILHYPLKNYESAGW